MVKNRLKEIRTEMGLTQEEFGEKVGASKYHINKLENGKRQLSIPLAVQFAERLNEDKKKEITIWDLFLKED